MTVDYEPIYEALRAAGVDPDDQPTGEQLDIIIAAGRGPLFLVVDEDPDSDASTTLYDAAGDEVEVAVLTLNGYYASKHSETSERFEYLLASLEEARENRELWPAPVMERAVSHAKTVAARTDVRLADGSWVDVTVDWDLLYVTGPLVAHFTAQAWVNDNAIEIDTRGELEWDCTQAFAEAPDHARREMLAELAVEDRALDGFDVLKDDPNAPEWIREHQGPFDIHVRYAF